MISLEINQPETRNCLWWPCLSMDQNEMSNLNRGPSIELWVFWFRPSIKLIAMIRYNGNIVESVVKHHIPSSLYRGPSMHASF
jgi:hypothetical protein